MYARVMVDVAGVELTQEDKEFLKHPNVGGVIIFARNFENARQLQALVKQIRLCKSDLLIAVDQEGGRVQRLDKEFSKLPPLAAIGKIYDKNVERGLTVAYNLGWLMATEVLSIGIDFSFAPILDVQNEISRIIGDRAFHSNPNAIAKIAEFYIKGMENAGMKATGKHYPGHGSIAPDSHVEIPEDNRSITQISELDLLPFKLLVEKGLTALMPAHIIYTQVDSLPACFSKVWLQQLLRGELNFKGVIFSDDLCMHGASIMGSHLDRAKAALSAGCDMVLVCNDRAAATSVVEGLGDVTDKEVSIRLSSMRGRRYMTFSELETSPRWQATKEMLNSVLKNKDVVY